MNFSVTRTIYPLMTHTFSFNVYTLLLCLTLTPDIVSDVKDGQNVTCFRIINKKKGKGKNYTIQK